MKNNRQFIISRFIGMVQSVMLATALLSCERIYEDLEPCQHGVSLRFVYDYNMEYANAFPKKVDCLTLLVYDGEGRYVTKRVVTGTELRDEAYRMTLDLEEGDYRFVAYGGLACEKSSFEMVSEPDKRAVYDDLQVVMDREGLTVAGKKRLHDMYWGELSLRTADSYREGVVEMMKNTNNIRIVLQQTNGDPVNDKDFEFEITDDNTLFGVNNDLIDNGVVRYTPWAQGQASTGVIEGGKEAIVAYAEFSTSRLMTKNAPRLVIKRKKDGTEIIDIPLNNYLLLLKSELYAEMDPQEFLDRESEWSLIFFLRSDYSWLRTYIKVNDWTVRLNETEL